MKLPNGYLRVCHKNSTAFTIPTALEWTQSVFASGDTLYDWVSRHSTKDILAGRGRVFIFPAIESTDSTTHWILRHYQRGGLLAPYLDDRYLVTGTPRPLKELRVSKEARSRGIPTPRIIGGATYRSGLFYRADLITEYLSDATDLASVLFGLKQRNRALCITALHTTGKLVRLLEKERVAHADLNASNILVNQPGGACSAHVIDLDRCRPLSLTAPAPVKLMRRRLEHSLKKLAQRHGQPLDKVLWMALRDGYETWPS
ncbi:MAG: hypothetical protein CM1200mP14_21180 [Gammaproteobacteria bacterium]|jgi:3-deoxy-D-manno-octulosonic acid kinase|nr:MAG: hypothetical protein CM1200mP14_21180 [Gammaproteobacteria bacterium]